MDALALGASVSVLVCVLLFALAFFSSSAASSLIRGRLEGALTAPLSVLESAASSAALREAPKSAGPFSAFISGEWLKRIEHDLRLADSHLQPVDLITMRIAFAGAGLVAPYLFLGGIPGVLLALVCAFLGFQAPQMWMNRRRESRKKKLEEQLPEALTFTANSLKAGFGLLQALSMASDQLQHPIATELAQTVHETNIGSSTEEAFLALGERCGSYDMDLVVTAVLIQRSAGGNLAEILETVASTMRERVRIRGEINTLTAQQRLTGFVISLLPVAVGGMFLLVSPDYILILFTRTIGQVMLGMALFLQVLGVIIIGRILQIEV